MTLFDCLGRMMLLRMDLNYDECSMCLSKVSMYFTIGMTFVTIKVLQRHMTQTVVKEVVNSNLQQPWWNLYYLLETFLHVHGL